MLAAQGARLLYEGAPLTTRPRPGLAGRVAHLWPIRIALYAGSIAGAVMLVNRGTRLLAGALGDGWPAVSVRVVVLILAVHLVYRGVTRLLEDRTATELSSRGAVREAVAGAVVGAVCLSFTVAILFVLGYYRVESVMEDERAAAWSAGQSSRWGPPTGTRRGPQARGERTAPPRDCVPLPARSTPINGPPSVAPRATSRAGPHRENWPEIGVRPESTRWKWTWGSAGPAAAPSRVRCGVPPNGEEGPSCGFRFIVS